MSPSLLSNECINILSRSSSTGPMFEEIPIVAEKENPEGVLWTLMHFGKLIQ